MLYRRVKGRVEKVIFDGKFKNGYWAVLLVNM